MADFQIFNRGTVIGFQPMNAEAHEWWTENVDEGYGRMGRIVWSDHRPARDLIVALMGLGFTVEEA